MTDDGIGNPSMHGLVHQRTEGDPVGFIEGRYRPRQGALFFAASHTSQGVIQHLVRDVPDNFTHHGWSPQAEYRRNQQWVPIADALGTDAHQFNVHPSDWANLRGRWRLTNSRGAGDSVAAELCTAAIDWWDEQQISRHPSDESDPQMMDFCAVFPSLWARRSPDDPEWNLDYVTDTACWTRKREGSWYFNGRIPPRLRGQADARAQFSASLWREYADARTRVSKIPDFSEPDLLQEEESIAKVLAISADFPVLLPLLPLLMAEERWTFTELGKYSALNAEAEVRSAHGVEPIRLVLKNGLSSWASRGKLWQEEASQGSGEDCVQIGIEHLLEASLKIDAGETHIDQRWTEEFHGSRTFMITDTEAAGYKLDFPIYDVVRGNENLSDAGWRRCMDGIQGWNLETVRELSVEHHMPDWPWDEGGASTTAVEVSPELIPLLEQFFDRDNLESNEIWGPKWSDFLQWVRDWA
ncbi:hypothetical protein ACX80J_16090 [Arthrobacter sp. MDB2-24]